MTHAEAMRWRLLAQLIRMRDREERVRHQPKKARFRQAFYDAQQPNESAREYGVRIHEALERAFRTGEFFK